MNEFTLYLNNILYLSFPCFGKFGLHDIILCKSNSYFILFVLCYLGYGFIYNWS